MQEPGGPIDGDDEAEDDLWFLPGPVEEAAWDMPGPKAGSGVGFDTQAWIRAEREAGQDLAAAAAAFAALSERQAQLGQGAARRLALLEAAELSWASGQRLGPEKIALHSLLRLPAAGDEAQALELAVWGAGRLSRGPGPGAGLAEFLGRRSGGRVRLEEGRENAEAQGLPDIALLRPQGAEFERIAAEWERTIAALLPLHPLSRAAAGFFAWRMLSLSGDDDVVEAAVTAARSAAEGARGEAVFVPLALGDALIFRSSSVAETALLRWLKGVENACLRALLMLEQLSEWKQRAAEETAELSGRSPPLLIEAFFAHPALSAEMAAAATGISRVGARRNLALFQKRGLIRETTGQDRYRVWTASL